MSYIHVHLLVDIFFLKSFIKSHLVMTFKVKIVKICNAQIQRDDIRAMKWNLVKNTLNNMFVYYLNVSVRLYHFYIFQTLH